MARGNVCFLKRTSGVVIADVMCLGSIQVTQGWFGLNEWGLGCQDPQRVEEERRYPGEGGSVVRWFGGWVGFPMCPL